MSFARAHLQRVLCSRFGRAARVAVTFTGAAGLFYGYTTLNKTQFQFMKPAFTVLAKSPPKELYQGSIISGGKDHALFLTIHLKPDVAVRDCLKAIGLIEKHVDAICPPDLRDESDEIWYGVGFGHNFLEKIQKVAQVNGVQKFPYRARSGANGDLPSTGGDIFIHAKCNQQGKLYELCQAIINNMPKGAVTHFEDVYGWVYRGGRDLSGFIDGTENPADDEDRIEAAIDPKTGGSYVVTQKWIHNHEIIRQTRDKVKEGWIGRSIVDSQELKKKPNTSHVARMVGSADFDAPAKYQIVRHSMPWGTVSGDSGLFFIAYSKSPVTLDWMLDRMTGEGADKQVDDVMRMTRCVTGTYWFFPKYQEFRRIVGN